jgi:prevent-host-death family protein
MKTVSLTDFRSQASGMLTQVENGETIVVLRHGRPIAEVSPIAQQDDGIPSWKKPALRLSSKGAELSAAIQEGRCREDIL